MSMIGGLDVIFETAQQEFDVRVILDAFLDIWPDCLFQDADEAEPRLMSSVLTNQSRDGSQEFFVYKNRAAAVKWDREGWTAEHGNDMVHVLITDDPTSTGDLQLTLVVGSLAGDAVRLIVVVSDALERMGRSQPARDRPIRVNWEVELAAAGCLLGREQFFQRVWEIYQTHFPCRSVDDLVCDPREALRFCQEVQREVPAVPDRLVMKALMTRRKQGKKRAESL